MSLVPLLLVVPINTPLNTPQKRKSAWNWGRGKFRTLPTADGSIDLEDRLHVWSLYSATVPPPPIPPVVEFGKGGDGSFVIGGSVSHSVAGRSRVKGVGGRR